jgi:hypothetical protein
VLAAETAYVPDLSGIPVTVGEREEEGILYLDLQTRGKDGERS